MKFPSYPVLQIRPSLLLVYEHIEWPGKRKVDQEECRSHNFHKAPTYDGLITHSSKKKLRCAIETLVCIAKKKNRINPKTGKEYSFTITFATLTLPSYQYGVSDKKIKSAVFDPWLKRARRRWKLLHYVWRAERQTNGNIHFHIMADVFIPYNELKDTWNENLNALGFIDAFEKLHGHRHPNSTDIHSVKKIKNLAAYCVKYCTKGVNAAEDYTAQVPFAKARKKLPSRKKPKKFQRLLKLDEQRIEGKIWDCSVNLKGVKYCSDLLDSEYGNAWHSAVKDEGVKMLHREQCTIALLTKDQFETHVRGKSLQAFNEWKEQIRNKQTNKLNLICQSITNSIPLTGNPFTFQQSGAGQATNAKHVDSNTAPLSGLFN